MKDMKYVLITGVSGGMGLATAQVENFLSPSFISGIDG